MAMAKTQPKSMINICIPYYFACKLKWSSHRNGQITATINDKYMYEQNPRGVNLHIEVVMAREVCVQDEFLECVAPSIEQQVLNKPILWD